MRKKLFIMILCVIISVMAGIVWMSPLQAKGVSDQISGRDSNSAPRTTPYRVAPSAPEPFSLDDLVWNVRSNMPTARYGGVTGTFEGEIFVSHGKASEGYTRAVEAYDPATDTWRTDLTPGLTSRRMVAGGAMYENNYLYVVGGYSDSTGTVGTLEIYDMSRDTWTTGLQPCHPRYGHGGAVLDGYVYVFGNSDSQTPNSSVERYNISTGMWETIPHMPNGAGGLCGATAAGKVYAIGGLWNETVMREYNPSTNTWTLKRELPRGRVYAQAVTVNNLIYVCGGDENPTSVDVYDPATNSWISENDMPGAISLMQLGQVGGSVYVIGGTPQSSPVQYQNQCWQGTFGVLGQPAAVSDLEAVASDSGALSCSLSWVNPTLDALGDPLTALIGIRILRDGVQITDLTPVGIGAAMEYVDNSVPAPGFHYYNVHGYNSSGDGIQAYTSLWIGPDIPHDVNDLLMIPGANYELMATLTWINPSSGVYGVYYPGVTGYSIVRDSDEGNTATFDLPGTHTSFSDTTIPEPGNYWYEVTPYNGSGNGLSATSNIDWVGIGDSWTWLPINYEWFDISGMGTNIPFTNDSNEGPFDLGFSFSFFGSEYSTIRACSNGWLSFTSVSNSPSNTTIPNPENPNNLIAMFWDDLNPEYGSGACYYYQDTANHRWIIQFTNISHNPLFYPETFQCVIYQTGDIEIHYQQVNYNESCTIGIEDSSGIEGIQVWHESSGEFTPTSNSAIRFSAPPPPIVGILEGYVYEEEAPQLPIEGAYVVVRNDTGYTNASGFYRIEDVYIGTTNATAYAFGYNYVTETVVIANYSTTTQDYYLTQPLIHLDISSIDLVLPASFPHDEEFYIFNEGNGPLDYDITIVGTGTDWLSIDPEQGTVTANDSQLVTASFLMPDTASLGDFYQADLTIDNNSNTPQIVIPVEVMIIDDAVIEDNAILPTEFALYQNYPNPFNPNTMISYDVPVQGMVQLEVFDVLGRKVATLVNGEVSAGRYHVTWNAGDMPSGVYFCRMQAESYHQVRKVVLLK